jgi:hypothetical protein
LARKDYSFLGAIRIPSIVRVFLFEKPIGNARRGFLDNLRGQISFIKTNKVPPRLSYGKNTKIQTESKCLK